MGVLGFRAAGAFVLVAVLAAVSYPALRDAITAGRASKAVLAALDAHRPERAVGPLRQWLAVRPRSAEAHFLKARVAFALGDLGEVSNELREAQKHGHPPDQLERFHAIVLSRVGDYAQAEPLLVQALNAARGPDPEVEEALARVYLRTYRLTLAAAMIERWMRDAPRDAKPYLWLTEIDRRVRIDDLSAQEAHYRAALERDPDLGKATLGLAQVLLEQHRADEAAREFARYLLRHPDDPEGLTGAGQVARELGRIDDAIDLLEHALRLAPDDPLALRERGAIDLHGGHADRALARLDRACAADPYDTVTRHLRCLALAQLGRVEEAQIERNARDRLKEEQAQLLAIRDRLVVDPNNNDLRAQIATWMFAHGRDEEGLSWARHILSVDPDHREANRLLAEYYRRRGEAGLMNYYRLRSGGPPS